MGLLDKVLANAKEITSDLAEKALPAAEKAKHAASDAYAAADEKSGKKLSETVEKATVIAGMRRDTTISESEPAAEPVELSQAREPGVPASEIPPAPPMPTSGPETSRSSIANTPVEVTEQPTDGPPAEKARSEAQVEPALGATEALREGVSLSVEDARQLLTKWATPKVLVDETVFSDELQVDNNPRIACTVVRLIETREEIEDFVPASQPVPALDRYDVGLDAIAVAEPTDFTHRSWRLVLAGSERSAPCPAGCMSGRQQCMKCQGGQVMCWSCRGSGQTKKTEFVKGKGLQTVERVERCGMCAGAGRVSCSKCGGSGWIRCSRCSGAGSVTWFVQANIDQVATPVLYTQGVPVGIDERKIPDSEWILVSTTPGDLVPEAIPPDLRGDVSAELAKHPPNELMRKLEITALPYAVIRLTASPDATIAIIGKSRIVSASHIASKRRVWIAVAVAVIIAAIAIIAIIAVLLSQ